DSLSAVAYRAVDHNGFISGDIVDIPHIEPDVTNIAGISEMTHLKFFFFAGVQYNNAITAKLQILPGGDGWNIVVIYFFQFRFEFRINHRVCRLEPSQQTEKGNDDANHSDGYCLMASLISSTRAFGIRPDRILAPIADRRPPAQCTTIGLLSSGSASALSLRR